MVQSPDIDEAIFASLMSERRIVAKEQLNRTLQHLKPVFRRSENLHYAIIDDIDVHAAHFVDQPTKIAPVTGLEIYTVVPTLHWFGFKSHFRPTLAEVLIMLPEDLPSGVIAFELVGPITEDDFNRQQFAIEKGLHAANAILYTR